MSPPKLMVKFIPSIRVLMGGGASERQFGPEEGSRKLSRSRVNSHEGREACSLSLDSLPREQVAVKHGHLTSFLT